MDWESIRKILCHHLLPLLNITLFKEQNFQSPIQLTNDLDGAPSDDIEDKLDLDLGLDEDEEEEEEDDDTIFFGLIPNPLAKIQKDIQSNVDSFLSNRMKVGSTTLDRSIP